MTCQCPDILARDPSRHFKGCPMRAQHPRTAVEERLLEVIRRIVVDLPNDEPNGEVERALADIDGCLDEFEKRIKMDPRAKGLFQQLNEQMARLCTALADDNRDLRDAARKMFGEDLGKP